MKLTEYRQKRKLTLAEFGEQIGASAETVRRYEAGLRYPDPVMMERIISVSKGKVSERDFREIAQQMAARRAERQRSRSAAA
ncbi:hypothetical protein TSH58p_17475 [Azospirillum sp. TSH58]|uniref:helix-turn-helix domain-containing protein n=1 Tax=Azospirillum sp. TSH58 TaxID=664962 RepID=UPI000D5FE46E|nr:helix-turn-helix transcriptional regulator [Azospirillum sp. TSH58]AWJ85155.1 hypothetical protein TSH58p_17475 [Azospirillum sp. TSH58]PWC80829.1 hypothetical protein TSH58_00880 [Azospirillum sp. TSH58]